MHLMLHSFTLVAVLKLLFFLHASSSGCSADLVYKPAKWNTICKYYAYNVPRTTFYKGRDGNGMPLFPLEPSKVIYSVDPINRYKSCFGPTESWSEALVRKGKKLPCRYTPSKNGATVNYWEEQACEVVHRNNCYCYALDRSSPGYCLPGIASLKRGIIGADLNDCTMLVAAIIADGGRPVDRTSVYTEHPRGTHYIAAAVWPSYDSFVGGDFHFWRLDGQRSPNGTIRAPQWSYKAGSTFARNTFRDGAAVRNVEDPAARGAYRLFCGYFDVNRAKHTLGFVRKVPSEIAQSYTGWLAAKLQTRVLPEAKGSPGWYSLYRSDYIGLGWEDRAGATRAPPLPPILRRPASPPGARPSSPSPKPRLPSPTRKLPTPSKAFPHNAAQNTRSESAASEPLRPDLAATLSRRRCEPPTCEFEVLQ